MKRLHKVNIMININKSIFRTLLFFLVSYVSYLAYGFKGLFWVLLFLGFILLGSYRD